MKESASSAIVLRLLIAAGLLALLPMPGWAADWNAARDLKNNELLGPPKAAMNPNPSVTNWSYGYRTVATLASTNLTLMPLHNPGGSPDLRGWVRTFTDGPHILINVTTEPIVLSYCCGPLLPINPGEMAIGPGPDATAPVFRWVAPATANYDVVAYWKDIDPHGGNGAAGSIIVDGTNLFTQDFPNGGSTGYTNTVAFSQGAIVDFVLGPNGDYSYDNTTFNATLTIQSLGALPAVNSVSASPGVAPIRSSNPWRFSATYSTLVSDLRVRVQSTETTNNEASWTDLPGNPYMTHVGSDWTLNTTDVPTGNRSFRVIVSAPFYTDAISTVLGPFNVLDGIGPFGDFSWQTSFPAQTSLPWIFTIVQPSPISTLQLRVQSSLTPSDPNSWTDLAGGGQMGRLGSTWSLSTTNVPGGTNSFRVVAAAPTYLDRISGMVGPFDIRPTLPIVSKPISTSGQRSLLSFTETQTPSDLYFIAYQQAFVQFNLPSDHDFAKLEAALTLAAEHLASAEMLILSNQTVTLPALNVGPGARLELKGVLKGDLSLVNAAALTGESGSTVIGDVNPGLAHDAQTATLLNQDGSGLLNQDGSGLINQDGSAVVSQGGGNVFGNGSASKPAPSAGSVVAQGAGQVTSQGGPTQPDFTGLMTIDGNYNQAAGTLGIGIAGTNTASQGAQQYDQLVVSGTANLFGGTIAVGLFNPDDQTNRAAVFQPLNGATFDVLVASNIVVSSTFKVRGRIWGEGLFFNWGIITRPDGLQALRLVATAYPPPLGLSKSGSGLQLIYPTNYTGYTVQSTLTFSPTTWTTFSTGTNVVTLSPTNASRFFRLSKP